MEENKTNINLEFKNKDTDTKFYKFENIGKLVNSFLTCVSAIVTAAVAIFAAITINNYIVQEQTQIVIEPREGDIIVQDGANVKLLQLINADDILVPEKIQEVRNKPDASANRIEINNINNEDWSKRDSFSYVLDFYSINSNKLINLLGCLESIYVYCDFYLEKNIGTKINLSQNEDFSFPVYSGDEKSKNTIEVNFENVVSEKSYVTKELNNGFEWAKIRTEIKYKISDISVKETFVSGWLATDADMY